MNNNNKSDTRPIPKLEVLREQQEAQQPTNSVGDDDSDDDFIVRRSDRRTGIIGGLLYFAGVLGVSVVVAILLWMATNDVIALNKPFVEATITVDALPYDASILKARLERNSDAVIPKYAKTVDDFLRIYEENGFKTPPQPVNIDKVTKSLANAGIIDYKWLFKVFAGLAHAELKIEPGVYTINTTQDYRAIISSLRQQSKARAIVEDILIPEGYTSKQIFALLEKNEICSATALAECADNYDFSFDFLADIPLGTKNRLEGFLFPDTYDFYVASKPEDALRKMLNNFDSKFNIDLQYLADKRSETLREIITVASLIEREAANNKERPVIASVIYNRLGSDKFPYLQIDASIQYALPEHKEKLTAEDLQLDSLYNTYKYEGLPPGPIANPGIASIKAALTPDTTKYYFYALDKEGNHQFFQTEKEHTAFVQSDQFVNN